MCWRCVEHYVVLCFNVLGVWWWYGVYILWGCVWVGVVCVVDLCRIWLVMCVVWLRICWRR